jgi:predicted YcjX-like family ATPase
LSSVKPATSNPVDINDDAVVWRINPQNTINGPWQFRRKTQLSDSIQRQIDLLTSRTLRLGVTGFARAGKTVFLGAVAQALLTAAAWKSRRGQGPLAGFAPFESRTFRSVCIRDDIDPTFPQFPFRQVRDCLVGHTAQWPEPTEGLSQLILDIHFEPKGMLGSLKRSHLIIYLVDYPGEWLIDLPMLEQGYAEWSEQMWKLANSGSRAALSADFCKEVSDLASKKEVNEDIVTRIAQLWSHYLTIAAEKGLVLNQPGRMIRPDSLRGSPVLRFFPLPPELDHLALRKKLELRFDQYKSEVVKPFYKDHFAKVDRQIVLLDVLRAIELGEEAFSEMEGALERTLRSFNYSKGGVLDWLVGRRTTKVLFAATKADHVIRGDRSNLAILLREMIAKIAINVPGEVIEFDVQALASICATEDYMTTQPPQREILFGRPAGGKETGQWDPGGLPLDIPPDWQSVHFQFLRFEPPVVQKALLEGFPAINLGKALDFLIGEDIS